MTRKQAELIKAQWSSIVPTESDEGTAFSPDSRPPKSYNSDGSEVKGTSMRARQMARDRLDGKIGNPSQLGDPISLKAETDDYEPQETDNGPGRQRQARESKL